LAVKLWVMKYHFTSYRYHFLVLSLIAVLFSSCFDRSNKPENIELSDTLELRENGIIHDTATVVFAISSMTTPRETYIYYNDLLDYFSIKTGKEVSLKQRKTYKETNDLIKKGEVDIAFICTGAYIDSKDDSSSHLIVVPVINGHPFYYAYIITHVNSGISKFEDLKGKKFAYTDPLSNTGYFYPQYRLEQLSTTEENFFSTTLYTYAHDLSIELINNNIVSAASVDGLIFDYLAKQKPGKVKNIKIIENQNLSECHRLWLHQLYLTKPLINTRRYF